MVSEQENTQQPQAEQKISDKELNFRNLEAKYQRQLEQERMARLELEKKLVEKSKPALHEEDDDDDEPYVDKKRLEKKLHRFGEQSKQQTKEEINVAVQSALQEERKHNWLKQNQDFYEVLQFADKFANQDPELAETILQMPEGFERQKLVYKSIKALGLHKPEEKKTIQQKVDANRRSPYYQPTGVASSPYSSSGDFSEMGQKQAYEQMQKLKKQLRI